MENVSSGGRNGALTSLVLSMVFQECAAIIVADSSARRPPVHPAGGPNLAVDESEDCKIWTHLHGMVSGTTHHCGPWTGGHIQNIASGGDLGALCDPTLPPLTTTHKPTCTCTGIGTHLDTRIHAKCAKAGIAASVLTRSCVQFLTLVNVLLVEPAGKQR
jgi:hypothetical protein